MKPALTEGIGGPTVSTRKSRARAKSSVRSMVPISRLRARINALHRPSRNSLTALLTLAMMVRRSFKASTVSGGDAAAAPGAAAAGVVDEPAAGGGASMIATAWID